MRDRVTPSLSTHLLACRLTPLYPLVFVEEILSNRAFGPSGLAQFANYLLRSSLHYRRCGQLRRMATLRKSATKQAGGRRSYAPSTLSLTRACPRLTSTDPAAVPG